MPPTVRSIDNDLGDNSVTVTFTFNGDPQVRTFREDRSIVIDVSHDGAKPKAAEQDAKPKQVAKSKQATAPAAVPDIAQPETVPVRDPPPCRRRRPIASPRRPSQLPRLRHRRLQRRLRPNRLPQPSRRQWLRRHRSSQPLRPRRQ